MDKISAWIYCICAALIVCEIFNLITPENRYKKTITIVLSAFFLICFISPFIKSFADFNEIRLSADKEISQNADKTDEILLQIYFKAENKIKLQIEEILKKNDINCEKINVIVSTEENGSIKLDRILINLNKKYISRTTQIEKLIFDNYYVIPEISFS